MMKITWMGMRTYPAELDWLLGGLRLELDAFSSSG
jgi:hypothetical protein